MESHIHGAKDSNVIFKGSNFNFPYVNKRFEENREKAGKIFKHNKSGYDVFNSSKPFKFFHDGGVIPELKISYETWGVLKSDKSNAVLVCGGISSSSHAKSTDRNQSPGWWEPFIGPGSSIDTNKFFVICTNYLGGCYGSTGPSSINPITREPYATKFPLLSVVDMVNAQYLLVEFFTIKKLYAVVGYSIGGMLSLTMSALYPELVNKSVVISACARTSPASIALQYVQRRSIMNDVHWNNGYYYGKKPPIKGLCLAREVAFLSYRSSLEWDERFGRKRILNEKLSLCPNYEIEQYVNYQGLSFCDKYDANTMLYFLKAISLFDIDDVGGLSKIKCPVLVIGIIEDKLFPITQQREMCTALKELGNRDVTLIEINGDHGHDSSLLDIKCVGGGIKSFL